MHWTHVQSALALIDPRASNELSVSAVAGGGDDQSSRERKRRQRTPADDRLDVLDHTVHHI